MAPVARSGNYEGPGFVYMLASPLLPGFVKLGLTKNTKRRLSMHRTSLPEAMFLVTAKVDNMLLMEQGLHARFGDRRHEGEWFKGLGKDEVVAAIDLISSSVRQSIREASPPLDAPPVTGVTMAISNPAGPARLNWPVILQHAATVVHNSRYPMDLRSLHYALVSLPEGHEARIPNTVSAYKTLSDRTTRGREDGTFPDLSENGRPVGTPFFRDGVADALACSAAVFKLDRTLGQDYTVVLVVEKRGLLGLLEAVAAERGWVTLATGGYASHTQKQAVRELVERSGRPAVCIIASDYDASGEDIARDFIAKTDCWAHVVRIGLTLEQCIELNLPQHPGKSTDSRAATFSGGDVQVELNAVPGDVLASWYEDAALEYHDESVHADVLEREQRGRDKMNQLAREMADWDDDQSA